MATTQQIELLFAQLVQLQPADFLKQINEFSSGTYAVLRFLQTSEGRIVTAGNISEHLGVSTARVAVLLKKLAAKGLVTKENHPSDARITVVRLSDFGRKTVQQRQNEVYDHLGRTIDKIGMDKILEFIAISKEIHDDMKDTVGFAPHVQ